MLAPPVRPAAPAPVPAPPARSSGPAEAVQRFFAAIDGKRCGEAYDMLSPVEGELRGVGEGYDTTVHTSLGGVQVIRRRSGDATVTHQIFTEDREGGRPINKKFQGTWQLVNVDGAWKLDTPSIRQVE
jgi:hypothetical protein